MPSAGAVILAAGRSQRMGRAKALLPLAGRTLLAHVIDAALAAGLDEVVAVLRDDDDEARRALTARGDARVRALSGDASREGLGGSLRLGLAALGPETAHAVVLLADQPEVEPALIRRLLDEAARTPEQAVRPVFAGAGGRVPGHPVVLPRGLFARAAAAGGDAGARSLFRDEPALLREIPVDGPAPADVDTPADYARLLAAHGSGDPA